MIQIEDILFKGWWAIFILLPCIIGIFTKKDKTGSIIGLVAGFCLLLASNDIFPFFVVWVVIVVMVAIATALPYVKKKNK